MAKVISFGHRCSSASILQHLQLKTESYPFDWLISKLDVIQDCIETKFVHFLNTSHYEQTQTETYNQIDDVKTHICNESIQVNQYYEKDPENRSTYQFKLAMNHQNVFHDYEYYQRCIDRLYHLFESDIRKYSLYFHPIMGIQEYEMKVETLLQEFDSFNQYILGKTQNIVGIYFILVRSNQPINGIRLKETSTSHVFVVFCNEAFLDGGAPFMGNFSTELHSIFSLLSPLLV